MRLTSTTDPLSGESGVDPSRCEQAHLSSTRRSVGQTAGGGAPLQRRSSALHLELPAPHARDRAQHGSPGYLRITRVHVLRSHRLIAQCCDVVLKHFSCPRTPGEPLRLTTIRTASSVEKDRNRAQSFPQWCRNRSEMSTTTRRDRGIAAKVSASNACVYSSSCPSRFELTTPARNMCSQLIVYRVVTTVPAGLYSTAKAVTPTMANPSSALAAMGSPMTPSQPAIG